MEYVMSRKTPNLINMALGIAAAGILLFGATQLGAVTVSSCSPFSVGTCPPLDDDTCWLECDLIGKTGFCIGGCCECLD